MSACVHEHWQFPLLSLCTHSALTISLIHFVFTSVRKRVAYLDGWARFAKPLTVHASMEQLYMPHCTRIHSESFVWTQFPWWRGSLAVPGLELEHRLLYTQHVTAAISSEVTSTPCA